MNAPTNGNASTQKFKQKLARAFSKVTTRVLHRYLQEPRASRLIARLMPHYVLGPRVNEYFPFWEQHGFHVTPVHFYQPIPDTRQLGDELWTRVNSLPGVDMNEARQLEFLQNIFPQFQAEYDQFPKQATATPYEFYFDNGAFSGTDALVLYCMARHFQPQLILEVGSGFSSRVSAQAALRNGQTQLVCIEPYPDEVIQRGFPGLTKLISEPVQRVELKVFAELQANDILFIDSSHVVTCGSDVNFLFLEILPRLNPGVIVHVHDIFLPQEYPQHWIKDLHLFWTEQYLLQAFLACNSEFEVLYANTYMASKHLALMKTVFPLSPWHGGGSFWMRRKERL